MSGATPTGTPTYVSELGGRTYPLEAWRPPWRNPTPLVPKPNFLEVPPRMSALPLHEFPVVEDFRVVLVRLEPDLPEYGYTLVFESASLGWLASFPVWHHPDRDLPKADFKIPLGTLQRPFEDADQGWELMIAAYRGEVYVAQGELEGILDEGFAAWFKVPEHTYVRAWEEAIGRCRELAAAEGRAQVGPVGYVQARASYWASRPW